MNKKTATLVTSVCILAVTATGCSGEKVPETPSSPPPISSTEIQSSSSTDIVPPAPTQSDVSSITEYTLAYYHPYSNNVAWVKGHDEIWRCIDKSGNIVFDLEAGARPVSNFVDVIAIIETESEYLGITTKNEVVASLSKSDYRSIDYLNNKFLLVEKETKTLEGNTNEFGVFDMSKNEWKIPLGEFDDILIKTWANVSSMDYVYPYSGETLVSVQTKGISIDALKELMDDTTNDYTAVFADGEISWLSNWDEIRSYYATEVSESIEKITNATAYNVTKVLRVPEPYLVVTIDDNLILVGLSNKDGTGSNIGIYDKNGSLVADLSEYKFESVENIDGALLAKLRNPNGTMFTTAFEETGEMLFEPIEGEYKFVSDSVFYLKDGFYDINGNLVLKIEAGSCKDGFHNGVLWAELTKESGLKQLALIDKNGETLFETGYTRR